jgi:2-phosphoglycerate kinase
LFVWRQVALEVKKTLVDGDLLDVSQAQLEGVIFRVMRKRAFGDDFVSRYRMLTAFHMKRAPLVVLICGSVCTGKSTIAAKLSQVRCFFPAALALTLPSTHTDNTVRP